MAGTPANATVPRGNLDWASSRTAPDPDKGQRATRVCSLLPGSTRQCHARDGFIGAHIGRRENLRHDPLRQQRAHILRPATNFAYRLQMTGLTIRPWASSHRIETCSRIARASNYCRTIAVKLPGYRIMYASWI